MFYLTEFKEGKYFRWLGAKGERERGRRSACSPDAGRTGTV